MLVGSVTVPCPSNELDKFERLLITWNSALCFPMTARGEQSGVRLCVVLGQPSDGAIESATAIYERYLDLKVVFGDLVVMSASGEAAVSDASASRNHLFFEALAKAGPLGDFTFLNELDCFPAKRGWLEGLEAIVELRRFAWVIGAAYQGTYPIGLDFQGCLSPSALYQTGSAAFQDYAENCWGTEVRQSELASLALRHEEWWGLHLAKARSAIKNHSWEITSRFAQFYCQTQFLTDAAFSQAAMDDLVNSFGKESANLVENLFIRGETVAPLIQACIDSGEGDLGAFIQAEHARSHADSSTGLDQTEEPQKGLADVGVVEFWPLATLEEGENFMMDFQPVPVAVPALPFHSNVKEMVKDCFFGDWHLENAREHIWAGGGTSAMMFDMRDVSERLTVRLRGALPEGANTESLNFKVIGAEKVECGPLGSGYLDIELHDPNGIDMFAIVIEQPNPSFVDGDARDLSFVLFGVEINSKA